jgi:hypothetical protein
MTGEPSPSFVRTATGIEPMLEMNDCRAGVALVIGVGEYLRAEGIERLGFATQDAAALAGSLADPALCAFPPDQVVVLTDGEARRDEVVHRLSRWLPERARNTDLVVIYFAGHGMVQTVGRREEATRGMDYVLHEAMEQYGGGWKAAVVAVSHRLP